MLTIMYTGFLSLSINHIIVSIYIFNSNLKIWDRLIVENKNKNKNNDINHH